MSHPDSSTDAILTKLAAMQATLDSQQAAIVALQEENARLHAALNAKPTTPDSPAPAAHGAAHDDAPEEAEAGAHTRPWLTSRRSLLRGAAAATAAASVGAVALGAAQPVHAAPLTDGSALIIGQNNTSLTQTVLTNTDANTTVSATFLAKTSSALLAQSAIYGLSLGGASGVIGCNSGNGVGVYGFTEGSNGIGVSGDTQDWIGVYGHASGVGNGVSGDSVNGSGVHGSGGVNGWGVEGHSNYSYDFVASGMGIIGVNVQASVGAPTSGFFFIGDCIRDANGDLWLCTAGDGSTVGTWVKAAHAIAGLPGGATSYLAKPIRLFDSRPNQPAASNPGHPLQPNTSTKVQVAGVSYNTVTVPSPLAGAIGNVTVLNASSGAFVEIVPSGAGFTGASTANIGGPGQIVANGFNVALSGGALDIYVAGVAVDVIIDLFAIVS